MKKSIVYVLILVIALSSCKQSTVVEWVSTTPDALWKTETGLTVLSAKGKEADVEVYINKPLQTIEGFGSCFNELGWASLQVLSSKDRDSIFKELFAPNYGANFTICRMPVGANDFSKDWYSYNETPDDFDMKHFSIDNDTNTLIPFIKSALKYNPSLKLWASPWSPPTWMKYNHHYAMAMSDKDAPFNNGLKPNQIGKEGTDMFILDEAYYKAYSLYFTKFIQAYKNKGISISMVMPQNEFNSAQTFPSCTWTAKGLDRFLQCLVPAMQKEGVSVFFGTMERQNTKLVDTILNDTSICKYIKGVGFQWGGKEAIESIHTRYPSLTLYQTEQECGDGKNDRQYAMYTWTLMKHYFTNGANAYMYWNTSLKEGGVSHWGWSQNSLITVDTIKKTYAYTCEYYLLKHLSHYVLPGAKLLETSGSFTNLLAFINPDQSIVIVAQNDSNEEKQLKIKIGDRMISPVLKAHSFNTWVVNKV